MPDQPTGAPLLPLADLRFELVPIRRLYWPRLQRGSILRGALGSILREVVCDSLCPGPSQCRFASECAYQMLFAPRAPADATRLKLNVDRPRPFVVVPGEEGGDSVEAGAGFSFAVRLFGRATLLYPYVVLVFSQLMRTGFGPDRVPCSLRSVFLDDIPLSEGARMPETTRRALDLTLPGEGAAGMLEVSFLTPVYLKHGGREVRDGKLAFAALAKRARDRLSSLYHFYGGQGDEAPQPLDWDFRGIGREAERVECQRDLTCWHTRRRRSSRTGQEHPLSGLTGRCVYAAVPARLCQILELACWTHVGKHAAFGQGRISVRSLAGGGLIVGTSSHQSGAPV